MESNFVCLAKLNPHHLLVYRHASQLLEFVHQNVDVVKPAFGLLDHGEAVFKGFVLVHAQIFIHDPHDALQVLRAYHGQLSPLFGKDILEPLADYSEPNRVFWMSVDVQEDRDYDLVWKVVDGFGSRWFLSHQRSALHEILGKGELH